MSKMGAKTSGGDGRLLPVMVKSFKIKRIPMIYQNILVKKRPEFRLTITSAQTLCRCDSTYCLNHEHAIRISAHYWCSYMVTHSIL